jgi:hypothetical protein
MGPGHARESGDRGGGQVLKLDVPRTFFTDRTHEKKKAPGSVASSPGAPKMAGQYKELRVESRELSVSSLPYILV